MPLTPRQTNPGIPLHSEGLGGGLKELVGEVPPEWRCAIDLSLVEQPVPYDTEIPLLSDTILSTRVEQQFTSESMLRQVTKPAGIVTLEETYTDKYKQVGSRIKKFRPITDLPLIGLPSATRDVNTKNFGNYHFEETLEDSGTLFTQQEYIVERPDSAPEKFKELLPLTTESHVELGLAALPVLGDSEYIKSEGQQDVYTKKVSTKYRDPIHFPATLGMFKMTPEQQIAEGVDILDDNLLNISTVNARTLEASSEDLGDGTWTKRQFDEPSLFTKQVYEESRPEVWPERFRALAPLSTDSHLEDGIVAPPTLGTADVRKSEQQETVFKKKVETSVRDLPSLPTTHLHGQRYEDTFDLLLPYDEWIDEAGVNLGSPRTIVTPQGDGTDQVEQIDFSSVSAALNAYNLVFPGTTNLNNKLPEVLSDLEEVFEVNSGNGTYSETGAGYWTIRGSYALSIRGSGNGSAAVVADANFLLTPPFKPSVKTQRAVFFLPNPVTTAAVLAKLSAVLGVTVSDWPNFDPTPVTVVCTSRKVSIRAEANQHTQSGGSAITASDDDPCTDADCVSCDAASTSGIGSSTEVGLTVKTIRIPPCLHDAITLHATQDETATAQAYAFDGSSWGSCVPPDFLPADTGVITMTATGKVDCVAAATSYTTYPSGTYLIDTSAQPYKYGYAMIHVEVVTI